MLTSALLVAKNEVPGDVVEVGVADGNSALALRNAFVGRKKLYAYDTFTGMPVSMLLEDEMHLASIGGQKSKESVIAALQAANIIPVAGIFPDVLADNPALFPEQVCFAYIDVDNYLTTAAALERVWNVMPPGGAIAVHDYNNGRTLGVARAVDEFVKEHQLEVLSDPSGCAILWRK